MRLDHPNYIKLVIAAYHDKRLNNQLSPLLAQPTPAGIRKECATVYQERFDRKDEPMFRAFFGPVDQAKKFLAHIENFEVDKFRPLDSFLKEENKKGFLKEEVKKGFTNRNLELLAWLIDFKHRPFVFGMEVFLTEKERQILEIESSINSPIKSEDESASKPGSNNVEEFGIKSGTDNEEVIDKSHEKSDEAPVAGVKNSEEIVTEDKKDEPQNIKWKNPVAIGVLSVILSGAIYWGSKKPPIDPPPIVETNTGCMYWANDHYEKVPCDTTIKDGLKLSFDESAKNLRRITQEDTITERSIGKVHYIKDSGIKYYTESGFYPEDPSRPLKKLSRYMFEKYLRKKDNSDKYASVQTK
ncbi:MAG: hypothetical protein QM687_02150 [Ferruginibacter sp.]